MFRQIIFVFVALLLSVQTQAQEIAGFRDQVQTMYVAYYGRPGDEGGIHFWANQLEDADGDLSAIIDSFGNSEEFQSRFGEFDNEELVTNIYQQLLGRDPDEAGLEWYIGKLADGSFTLASAALNINDGVQGDDVDTVANKISVANEFTEQYLVQNVEYAENQIEDAKLLIGDVDSTSASVTAALDELTPLLEMFPAGGPIRVRMETSLGDIILELYADEAPITVANFLSYVDADIYDATVFHRVVAGFVVQGGGFYFDAEDPNLFVAAATMDPIENESSNGLKNIERTVAMARTSDPDSATSQFYFNLADNTNLDYIDGAEGYAVFAEVIEGWGVIKSAETSPLSSLSIPGVGNQIPQALVRVTVVTRSP
jgi:cyclophilin family peptidyl-prolyl cis-trans isomerase